MQGLLGRHRDRAPRCLGIALQQDAFGLARVEPGRSTCHAPLDEEALEKVVRRDRLRRHAAHLVLDAGDYRLLPTERPDVPEADLREALRWQIADLVDFDVTDAVLEFCPMGDGENHHGRSMVFAVAAPTARVRDGIHAVRRAGLRIASVGIPELALRNLALRLPEAASGLTLLYVRDRSATILLIHGTSLFVARRVDVAMDEDANGGLETLLLEIQRALDYYDGHFALPPMRHLVVMADMPVEDEALAHLGEQLRMQAHWLPLTHFAAELPDGGDACARALGAAFGPLRPADTAEAG